MGWVYRARHLALDSTVAVKLMKPTLEDDPSRKARFEREARAASRLSHPHIISVVDFGETRGGVLYLVTEFLTGTPLGALLAEGKRLPLGRAITLGSQLLEAVDEAHTNQLIHRDLKPDNLMIQTLRSGDEFVKVLDFGIARPLDRPDARPEARLTVRGELCGTPAYMAPELIRGQDATAQSDLYACGLILYEMLAGRSPFQTESLLEMLALQLHTMPLPLRQAAPEADLPEALEAVLARALAKDPRQRHASARELKDALLAAVASRRDVAHPCTACSRQPRSPWSGHCASCALAPTLDELHRTAPGSAPAASTGGMPGRDAPEMEPIGTAGTLHVPAVTMSHPTRQIPPLDGLLGRQAELAEIRAFLARHEPVLEILGPPGIGKTALLEAAAAEATRQGRRCLVARPDATLARRPWQPVQALVAQAIGLGAAPHTGATLRERALRAGLLAEDLPGLADLFGFHPPPGGRPDEVRLREITAAVRRALLLPGPPGSTGTCVLVDDATDLDGASLGLLAGLAARNEPATGLQLVIAADRSVLPAEGIHRSLYLAGLGAEDQRSLAWRAAAGHALPETVIGPIVAASAGNPLHLEHAARLALAGSAPPPATLADLLQARLAALDPADLRLLRHLSALGVEAPLSALAALVPAAGRRSDRIAELVVQGFLGRQEHPGETLALTLAHPLLADVLLEGLATAERRALHRAAYEVRLRQHAGPVELARQATAAGLGETALERLGEASAACSRALDPGGAGAHLQQARHLARWELLIGENDARYQALSGQLADALRDAGHLLAAELVYKETLQTDLQAPAQHARLLLGMAELMHRRRLFTEAESLARQALPLGLRAGQTALLMAIYTLLVDTLVGLGRSEAALAELEEGVLLLSGGEGAFAPDLPAGSWRLLERLAILRLAAGSPEEARQLGEQVLSLARHDGSLDGVSRGHLLLARIHARSGDAAGLERHGTAAVQALRRLGDRQGAAEALLVSAALRPGETQHRINEALDLARQVAWDQGIAKASALVTRSGGAAIDQAAG